jgi:hypothetical protein
MIVFRWLLPLLAAVLTLPALATTPKPEPKPAPAQTQQQTQHQAQKQAQLQQQRQSAQAAAAATATAAPVQTVDARTSSQASSSSGGNSLEVSEFNPRQSPGIAQGSFAIQGCGAAANAGGSNVGGAAFLGVGFTTPQCYDFMLAQAFAAAGAWSAACEVLNASPAGKRAARRGVRLPECSGPAAPVVPAALPAEIVVKVEDQGGVKCEERVDKAFKQCVSK